jgi:hypothetical protein
MQTLTQKLSRITTKPAGWTQQDLRHLIHGCGGSPRRANKAIRLDFAETLRDAYKAALGDGSAHATATQQCDDLWATLTATPDTEATEETDPHAAEDAAADEAIDAGKDHALTVAIKGDDKLTRLHTMLAKADLLADYTDAGLLAALLADHDGDVSAAYLAAKADAE